MGRVAPLGALKSRLRVRAALYGRSMEEEG